jgi:hypothetical protein
MNQVTIRDKEHLNPLEVMQVADYMSKHKPNEYYTMALGNNCIWVYFGSQNWYFIFHAGKIFDIQID